MKKSDFVKGAIFRLKEYHDKTRVMEVHVSEGGKEPLISIYENRYNRNGWLIELKKTSIECFDCLGGIAMKKSIKYSDLELISKPTPNPEQQ